MARLIGRLDLPNVGDELRHFGWKRLQLGALPIRTHPHTERRYLLVPGLRSSSIYVIDTQPDPRSPKIVRTIEPDELANRAGYSRPHTVHCGPDNGRASR